MKRVKSFNQFMSDRLHEELEYSSEDPIGAEAIDLKKDSGEEPESEEPEDEESK